MLTLESKILYEGSNYYVNKLTEMLDKCLTEQYKNIDDDILLKTYIYKDFETNIHLIRKFGATRGCIYVDNNNIIKDIKIYEDTGLLTKSSSKIACYTISCLTWTQVHEGYKIIFIDKIYGEK